MAKKISLKDLSLLEIQELLNQKIALEQKKLPKLLEKRDRLQAELDALNRQIETLEGGGGDSKKVAPGAARGAKRGPRRRARKGKGKRVTLAQAVAEVLGKSKRPMTPTEITKVIERSKHPSAQSASLRLQINNILTKREEFERLGRGQYQLKK